MNFIEKLIGLSPFGGSGGFEMLLLVIPLLVLVASLMTGIKRQRF